MLVGPRYRPAVPGDSRPSLRAHGIDEPSRVTRACDRDSAGSTSSPGRFGPMSEVPQGRPAVTGDLGPTPSARGVDPLPRAARAWFGVSSGSRSCPR